MKTRTEEFKVSGNDIIRKIKELINEGNIRKITIKNKDSKVIAEFPLTFGLVGTVIAPVLAAVGTIMALASECSISVEKEILDEEVGEDDDKDPGTDETEDEEE